MDDILQWIKINWKLVVISCAIGFIIGCIAGGFMGAKVIKNIFKTTFNIEEKK